MSGELILDNNLIWLSLGHVSTKVFFSSGQHIFRIVCSGSAMYLLYATKASSVARRWASILRWALHVWLFFWSPRADKCSTSGKTLCSSLSLFTQPSNHSSGGVGQIPQRPAVAYESTPWTISGTPWDVSSPTKSHEPTQTSGSVFTPHVLQHSLHPQQGPEQVLYLVPTFLHSVGYSLITQTKN